MGTRRNSLGEKRLQVLSGVQEADNIPVDQINKSALIQSHSSPHLSAGCCPMGRVGGCERHGDAPSLPKLSHCNNGDKNANGEDSITSHLSARLRLNESHDSGFSSVNNMSNVSSQRTSNYESLDHLRSSALSEPGVLSPLQSHLFLQSGPHSAHLRCGIWNEGSQYKSSGTCLPNLHYGSLDRKRRSYKCVFYKDVSPMRCTFRESDFNYRINKRDFKSEGEYRNAECSAKLCDPSQSTTASFSDPANSIFVKERYCQDKRAVGAEDNFITCHERCFISHNVGSSGHKTSQHADLPQNCPKEHVLGSTNETTLRPTIFSTERRVSSELAKYILPQQYREEHRRPVPSSGFDRHQSFLQQQHLQNYQQSFTSSSQSQNYWLNQPHTHASRQRTHTGFNSDLQCAPQKHVQTPHQPSEHHSHHKNLDESPDSVTNTLVTISRLHHNEETTKRYEISDFYRYSERLRRQRCFDQHHRQPFGSGRPQKLSPSISLDNDRLPEPSIYQTKSFRQQRATNSPTSQDASYTNSPNIKQPTRGRKPYIRSSSAPLSPKKSIYRYHHLPSSSTHQYELRPSSSPCGPTSNLPERNISTSSTFSNIHLPGTNTQHVPYQSSTHKNQQLYPHYQPHKVMTCKPINTPPLNLPDGHV